MSEATYPTEAEIAAVGDGPRITSADIEANIAACYIKTAGEMFFGCAAGEIPRFGTEPRKKSPLDLHTICVIVTKSGFTVTGESKAVSDANFNADIGKRLARADAIEKMWFPMGYELKQRLFNEANNENTPTA